MKVPVGDCGANGYSHNPQRNGRRFSTCSAYEEAVFDLAGPYLCWAARQASYSARAASVSG